MLQNNEPIDESNTYVLPFEVTKEHAIDSFLGSFAHDKLIPTEFFEAARHRQLEACYFPAYLFSCQTKTALSVECTMRKGEQVTQHTEKRSIESDFSQLLFSADGAVDEPLLRLLEPYDLEALIPYSKEAVDNTPCSSPAQEPSYFSEQLEALTKEAAVNAVKNELKSYTSAQVTVETHKCKSPEFSKLLLPMWVLSCDYKGKGYRIFLNGQTGKLVGVPPKSTNKIAAILGVAAACGAVLGQIIWLAVSALW